MTETSHHRIKRMRMRSWRRGTKEMDMILGPFADEQLAGLDASMLDLYDLMLHENDQDLYQWVSCQQPESARFTPILDILRAYLRDKSKAPG